MPTVGNLTKTLVLTIVNSDLEVYVGDGREGMSGKKHSKHLLSEVSIIGRYRTRRPLTQPWYTHRRPLIFFYAWDFLLPVCPLSTFFGPSRQMGTFYHSIDYQVITGYLLSLATWVLATNQLQASLLQALGSLGVGKSSLLLPAALESIEVVSCLPRLHLLVLIFSFTKMSQL